MSFSSNPQLRKRGLELFEQLYSTGTAASMTSEYRAKSTDYADMSLEWCIGGLLGRPGLDIRTREFIAMALCMADGRVPDAVLAHAEALVRLGVTKDEIYEGILMGIWYTGAAPVSIALSHLKHFFDDEPQPAAK
jgi:4-carboxymuconolactone decarboxylase